jgi:hypothetical protein
MAMIFLAVISSIVVLVFVVGLISFAVSSYKDASKRRYEREQEMERLQIAKNEQLKAEKIKEQAKVQSQWVERVAQYGEPTILFEIYSNPNRNIAVYEPFSIVFINEKKYDFKDILSCRIETITKVKKGAEIHITKPDSADMAMEQLLWGMGKKYNVKSTTQVIREDDKVAKTYIVYIGVNDIAEPQHKVTFYSSENANKLLSTINVIIERNKQA